MVLGVLEGLEAVHGQGLAHGVAGPVVPEEEQGVEAQAGGVGLDGGARHAVGASHLAQGGAGDQALPDGGEQAGPTQPVGGREGL